MALALAFHRPQTMMWAPSGKSATSSAMTLTGEDLPNPPGPGPQSLCHFQARTPCLPRFGQALPKVKPSAANDTVGNLVLLVGTEFP